MNRIFHRGLAQAGRLLMAIFLISGAGLSITRPLSAQADDPGPPAETTKLIFIHHSCGENWLTDGHGNLGQSLGESNYFVSDTNYGWGPDSIGDRTDITDWPEWFTGANSNRYLEALYTESEQNSWYTRPLADPGGENQVIMFKSCFPNSNLEGNPTDPPARGEWLTVSNAKAIYNELLPYFATRPDKLFIVITAPPVQDPTYAANARAFNTWLVTEWLAGYGESNVAVFDFYNVLTGPNNHHRFHNGDIEYITNQGQDTLYYPTDGDDHPSPEGNQKAAAEFIPLLNVYYHRWQSGASAPPPAPQPTITPSPTAAPTHQPSPTPLPTAAAETPAPLPSPSKDTRLIDDFENWANEWQVFAEGSATRLTCSQDTANYYSGTAGLRIEYDIAPEGWASCSLVYQTSQDWTNSLGLTIYLRAEEIGQQVNIATYQGESSDNLAHFELQIETGQQAIDGWQRIDILWEQLIQPPWEGDGTTLFDPAQAMGLAFLFAPDDGHNSGKLWVDDVNLLSTAPPSLISETPLPQPTVAPTEKSDPPPPTQKTGIEPQPQPTATPESKSTAEESSQENEGKGLCPGSIALAPMALIGSAWMQRRTIGRKEKQVSRKKRNSC